MKPGRAVTTTEPPRGEIDMTKNSEAVLEALETKKLPSSVADLAGLLEGRCDLATVYRSLHRLEAEGLVEAFAFECRERGIERYYLSRRRPHRHFFHCESCHRFIDLGECRLGGLVEELEREFDLEVESHTLYLTGRCKACAVAGSPAATQSGPAETGRRARSKT